MSRYPIIRHAVGLFVSFTKKKKKTAKKIIRVFTYSSPNFARQLSFSYNASSSNKFR